MASYQQNSPYAYNPSVYLALVATILFSALTCLLAFRMTQTRTWESGFFVLGGLGKSPRRFHLMLLCRLIRFSATLRLHSARSLHAGREQ